jgi:hypothetical protein
MNRPTDRDGESVPHDAWLREALRHAPDADAAPPPALSELILREARAATAPAAGSKAGTTTSLVRRLTDAWAWLSRPPVAAGFASVLLAGIVGLMWWDEPLEDMLPPREGPLTKAPPPAPPPAADARKVEPAPAPPRDTATPEAAPSSRAAPAPRERAAPKPRSEAAPRAVPAVPQASPPAAVAEAPVEAEAAPERRPRTVERDAAEPAAQSAAKSAATTGAAQAPAPRAPAAALALRRDAASGSASVGSLRAAIASQPNRWTWQRGSRARERFSPAMLQWLQQVDGATRTHWQAAGSASASDAGPPLTLWLDGRLHTRLRLDAAGVAFEPAAGEPQRAELPAASAAALQQALDEATR